MSTNEAPAVGFSEALLAGLAPDGGLYVPETWPAFTKDEIADPQNLKMWLTVNGKKRQDGSTKTMVYGVAHLVSYLSQFMSLLPGDIISTGTPPGVGMGMKPPKYLKNGDVVELGIEGLGRSRQKVVPSR